tara:strand:- start:10527 stop:11321 length:795 start_codon:yes stop_codon:yes gene_type:complete
MNEGQMAQQIRHILATATWPESPSRLVFGERMVFVVAGLPDEDELPGGFPFALVNIGGGTSDPDDPNLLEQSFDVLTVADVAGGRMGEQALVGGNKSSLGTSANRGVLELNGAVRNALKDLRGIDGAALQLSSTSAGSPVRLGRGRHLAIGESTFSGWITAAPSYTNPTRLAAAGSTWTWTGTQCSERFDFIQYRLGYVAGAVAAESPGDLDTIVYTGTNPTFSHSPVASKTYSVFADYGTRGGTAIDGSSNGRELGANKIISA